MRDTAPWLSVLMPVYNGARTLTATLNSVVGQADGIEIILVDQGSVDASLGIAASFAQRMDLRIISAPENTNWVQNTNLALGLARAPHATLLHQDDIWNPARAALLRRMFDDCPDAALWLHAVDYIDETGRVIGHLAPPLGQKSRLIAASEMLSVLMVQNTIAIPAAAFHVDAARAIGGLDESLWYTGDWDFWLKLATRGRTAWEPCRAAGFRLHAGSLTVSGSADLKSFAHQLEVPVARHAEALDGEARNVILGMARASNALNIWLASGLHGTRRPLWPVVMALLSVGPASWLTFLNRSQILQRLQPRLKLLRTGGPHG